METVLIWVALSVAIAAGILVGLIVVLEVWYRREYWGRVGRREAVQADIKARVQASSKLIDVMWSEAPELRLNRVLDELIERPHGVRVRVLVGPTTKDHIACRDRISQLERRGEAYLEVLDALPMQEFVVFDGRDVLAFKQRVGTEVDGRRYDLMLNSPRAAAALTEAFESKLPSGPPDGGGKGGNSRHDEGEGNRGPSPANA